MKPQPGTKSYKAYKQGIEAFNNGLGENMCPYMTNKVQMLRSWWMVGYHELNNKSLYPDKLSKRTPAYQAAIER
jgi:ribosome modulation factor